MSGPLKIDPPCRIASRYATTLIRISVTVTNGNLPVGMLSFSGITGCGPYARWAVGYARWSGAPTVASSQGWRASPSSANVHCSVNVVARVWLPARIAVVSRSSM